MYTRKGIYSVYIYFYITISYNFKIFTISTSTYTHMCIYIFPVLFHRFPYLQLGRNSREVIRLYRLPNKTLLRKDDFPFASCLVGYSMWWFRMVSQRVNNGWLTLNILSPDGLHCFLWCVRYWCNWGWHACWWQKYLMLEMRSSTKSTHPCFWFVYICLSIFLTDALFCYKTTYQTLSTIASVFCSILFLLPTWRSLNVSSGHKHEPCI